MKLLLTIKITLCLYLLLIFQSYGQDWNDYTPTRLGGQIPDEFLTTSTFESS